jgi:hypothetical protein
MPIVSPSSMEKTTTSADTSIHGWSSNTRGTLMSIATRLQAHMACPYSDMMTSRPWLMSSGTPGAVRSDHRRKTGSVPRKNCDHALALLKGPGRSDDEVKSIGSKLTDANGTADRGINQMSLKATSKPRSSQDQGDVLPHRYVRRVLSHGLTSRKPPNSYLISPRSTARFYCLLPFHSPKTWRGSDQFCPGRRLTVSSRFPQRYCHRHR